jgi:hypothetical protein
MRRLFLISMENTLAEVGIRQFVFTTRKEALSHAATRPTWPIVQVVLGGLLCAYLMGWVQDFQRIRDLRAEPVPLAKVVITKQEAWERIHAPRARRRVSPQIRLTTIPSQLVTLAAIEPADATELVLNGM